LIEQITRVVVDVGIQIAERRDELLIDPNWRCDDIKTQADRYAHRCLVERLTRLEPIPVISEEDTTSHFLQRPNRYWLIDPIDGTASLAKGYEGWVIQVALINEEEPLLAAIFAPDLDLVYTAQKGLGAFVNKERLFLSDLSKDRRTLIDNYPEPRGIAAEAMEAMSCTNYLESGSISLKICRVADGTADIFLKDVVVRDWDVAAPMAVLKEAGGFISKLDGSEFELVGNIEKNGIFVSSSAKLHQEVRNFSNSRIV
jgi:3'(2'), 5'-bisphosphate nucleotidase